MRHTCIIIALTLCGCTASVPATNPAPATQASIDDASSLLPSLVAFYKRSGRWPLNGTELASKTRFDPQGYENLHFEPLPDDGVTVCFDSYESSDGGFTAGNARFPFHLSGKDH